MLRQDTEESSSTGADGITVDETPTGRAARELALARAEAERLQHLYEPEDCTT